MRRLLLPAFIASAVILSGCGHDPLVHGPFVIGANPAPSHADCNPGAVSTRMAMSGWDKCMRRGPVPPNNIGTLPPPPPEANFVTNPPVSPPPRPVGLSRSAW